MTNRIQGKIISERRYKAGYVVKRELVDGRKHGGPDIEMRVAYTPSGDYIGSPKDAYHIVKRRGIQPEKSHPDHNVCSIGFCEREQKWYGWSHRAIFGFGIGFTIKRGDCGFVPSNKAEFIIGCEELWNEYEVRETNKGLQIISKNLSRVEPWPESWGRGEWTARTLGDARQMAVDFAESVS